MKNPVSNQEWKDAIKAFLEGNEEPFLDCVERYKPYFIQAPFIKSLFYQIKNPAYNIEDIFQDVFIKFWETYINRQKAISGSCNSLLGKIATNIMIDIIRKEKQKKGEKKKKGESEAEKRREEEEEEEAKVKAAIKRKEEESPLFNEFHEIKSLLTFNDNGNFFLEIKNELLGDTKDSLMRVVKTFNKLGKVCRIILGAHYIWEMKYKEIEKEWKIKAATAKAGPCRNKLRKNLELRPISPKF